MFGIFSFIGWLIIGAIIGWIAGKVWVGHGFRPDGKHSGRHSGIHNRGALFGGLLGTSGIGGWITSILGAIVLLVIAGFIKR